MIKNEYLLIGLIVIVIFLISNLSSSKEHMTNEAVLYDTSVIYPQNNKVNNLFIYDNMQAKPEMYNIPDLSGMPNMPSMSEMPSMPVMADLSDMPSMSNMHNMPVIADLSDMPSMSDMSGKSGKFGMSDLFHKGNKYLPDAEEKIYDIQYDQELEGRMPNDEEKLYGSLYGSLYGQALQDKMEMKQDDSMPNAEEKLYGSLYGQSLQGTINTPNQEDTKTDADENLYGSLYGQGLQGKMEMKQDNSMPNSEEKLYGSLYGQSLQENINIPAPMYDNMYNEFDIPMELEMDMPIHFNNPSDKVYVTNNGEDVVKESMNMFCTMDYNPVICDDGKIYDNMCKANNAGQMNCKSGFPKVKENFDNLNNDCKNQPKKYFFGKYTDDPCDQQPAIGWFRPFTNERAEAAASKQAKCREDCDRKFPTHITVFEHCDFNGRSLNCGLGITSFEQLERQGFNDIISSVRIPPGLKAIFYEHGGFGGKSIELTGDHRCLIDYGFNDIISSIIVQKI
jgi:hypothetical protein